MLHAADTIAALEEFASRPVTFRCRRDDRELRGMDGVSDMVRAAAADVRPAFEVTHELRPPADADSLAKLKSLLGPLADGFAPFYQAHDGFRLYIDGRSGLSALDMLPIHDWEYATGEMRLWLENCPDEYDPAHLKAGLALGYIPETADGFAVSLDGPHAGQLFFVRHSDTYMPPFAADFGQLVARLTRDPIELFGPVLGDHFRCTDASGASFVPEAVVAAAHGREA